MPRPARSLWVPRTYARRRHRTWMMAMTLASLGWGVWWTSLLFLRFWPGLAPSLVLTEMVAVFFAVPGILLGLASLRAKKSWIFFSSVAVFANGSLFLMPSLAGELFRISSTG